MPIRFPLEAQFDPDGKRLGRISRFSSREPDDRDIARLWRAIRGELPRSDPETGWRRPADCEDDEHGRASSLALSDEPNPGGGDASADHD